MTRRFVRRLLGSIYFFVLLGLVLGGVISVIFVPKPTVAEITLSGVILEQADVDTIIDELQSSKANRNIKAVVLNIDSPGGAVSAIEPIYFEILELKKSKPVVAAVRTVAASGGYYIAVATNFIYAQPNATVGSVGVIGALPVSEELDEYVITTGPFKRIGQSRRRAISEIETIRQQFVEAVTIQRGGKLKISEGELSQASTYSGTQSLEYGLIDDIGTSTLAMQKAAELAGIKNYGTTECLIQCTEEVDLEDLKSRTNNIPIYYYLYFELE
ncbi:S49 family peptidase [Chloroflexota bacterium]